MFVRWLKLAKLAYAAFSSSCIVWHNIVFLQQLKQVIELQCVRLSRKRSTNSLFGLSLLTVILVNSCISLTSYDAFKCSYIQFCFTFSLAMSFKDSDNDSRVLGLQEQVKSLSDELMQCQVSTHSSLFCFVWLQYAFYIHLLRLYTMTFLLCIP